MTVTESDYQQPSWITDMGDYNKWPEPHREIDAHRFIHLTAIYSPLFMDIRQIIVGKGLAMLHVTIFYYHHCAVAIVHPTKWTTKKDGPGIEYDLSQCKFYEIGCQHKYRELPQDECRERGISYPIDATRWHVNECETCGHINAYDSSD